MYAVLKVHVRTSCIGKGARGYNNMVVLDSSAVEHSAVNRRVVGSNPTRGVWRNPVSVIVCRIFLLLKESIRQCTFVKLKIFYITKRCTINGRYIYLYFIKFVGVLK